MKEKKRSIVIWAVVILTITLACACPFIPQEIFAVKEGLETVQSVLTDIPVDDLIKTAEALATEIPMEDILGTMEVMGTAMPVSPEDIAKTAAAGGLPVPLPGFGDNTPPPDIPIVGERNDDMIANKDVVNYTTPLTFNTVVDFYQKEMLNNGWQLAEDRSVTTPETAVLQYVKPDRDASVTIYVFNENTGVTITIATK